MMIAPDLNTAEKKREQIAADSVSSVRARTYFVAAHALRCDSAASLEVFRKSEKSAVRGIRWYSGSEQAELGRICEHVIVDDLDVIRYDGLSATFPRAQLLRNAFRPESGMGAVRQDDTTRTSPQLSPVAIGFEVQAPLTRNAGGDRDAYGP